VAHERTLPPERARIEAALTDAVARAREIDDGAPAAYIPQLACAPLEATSAAIVLGDGATLTAGDFEWHRLTLQSTAKVLLLAGALEDFGPEKVFSVVGTEPSGGSFASLARLETDFLPSNPLINAGAIALAGLLEGDLEDRLGWLEGWVEKLYGAALPVHQRVLVSERRTADKNRSIAHLLRGNGVIQGNVEDVLEVYFTLCSLEADVRQAATLPALLSRGGIDAQGNRLLCRETVDTVVALMATCGMYNESGQYLVQTGLPAKSGVSGLIIAVAPGRGGLAVASPRLNSKGGSVRGHEILRRVSDELGWHIAAPPARLLGPDPD